jgi:hypothetical protein
MAKRLALSFENQPGSCQGRTSQVPALLWVPGLWLALQCPAQASSTYASWQTGLPAFDLVAVLILLGYLTYLGYSLHSRIDLLQPGRLEASPTAAAEEPAVQAFSWDAALATPTHAIRLLGEATDLGASGIHVLAGARGTVAQALITNLVFEAVRSEGGRVLFVSTRTGMDELGQRLLCIESGQAWSTLGRVEQDALLRQLEPKLLRYQEQVQVLADLGDGLETLGRLTASLRASHPDVRLMVLIEEPGVLRGGQADAIAAWFDTLQRLAARNQAAVVVATTVIDPGSLAEWNAQWGDGCKTLARLVPDDGAPALVGVELLRSPQPAALTKLEISVASGQITPAR